MSHPEAGGLNQIGHANARDPPDQMPSKGQTVNVEAEPAPAAEQGNNQKHGPKRPGEGGRGGDAGDTMTAQRRGAEHKGVVGGDVDDVHDEHDPERRGGVARAAEAGAADEEHKTHGSGQGQDTQEKRAVFPAAAGELDEVADGRGQDEDGCAHDGAGDGSQDQRLSECGVGQAAVAPADGASDDSGRADAHGRLDQADDPDDIAGGSHRSDRVGVEVASLNGVDKGDQKIERLLEQGPDGEYGDLPREREAGEAAAKLALGGSERRAGNVRIGAGNVGFHEGIRLLHTSNSIAPSDTLERRHISNIEFSVGRRMTRLNGSRGSL